MPFVEALVGFEHNGPRRCGARFHLSNHEASQLVQKGLVRYMKANPGTAAGGKLSASPVAQASVKQTAKKSKSGGPGKKKEASSSQTQPSK